MYTENGELVCDHCGKVYNRYLGHRFWNGDYVCTRPPECESGGGRHKDLCNDCHRRLGYH